MRAWRAKKGVLIQNKLLEMPEALFPEASLNGLLSPEQAQTMLREFEKNQDVKVLSSPNILANDGVAASIHVGQQVPSPSGEQVFKGISVELTPVISDDGATVDLTIHPKLDLQNNQAN